MIGSLIGLIFLLIVLGLLWWAFTRILALVPIAEPFSTLIHIVVVVIGVLILLYVAQQLFAAGGVNVPWPNLK